MELTVLHVLNYCYDTGLHSQSFHYWTGSPYRGKINMTIPERFSSICNGDMPGYVSVLDSACTNGMSVNESTLHSEPPPPHLLNVVATSTSEYLKAFSEMKAIWGHRTS